jgi:hypothetical protein
VRRRRAETSQQALVLRLVAGGGADDRKSERLGVRWRAAQLDRDPSNGFAIVVDLDRGMLALMCLMVLH